MNLAIYLEQNDSISSNGKKESKLNGCYLLIHMLALIFLDEVFLLV